CLMAYRQSMRQAAGEGARAGAVAPAGTGYVAARARAVDATNKALGSFGEGCGNGRTTCEIVVDDPCPSSSVPCIRVTVTYDYANHPLMPAIPIVTNAIPSTFVSSSSAQLNS